MKYDIWIEGYQDNGGGQSASLLVSDIEGKDFTEAVKNWYYSDSKNERYYGKLHIENNEISLWGCRLFDNEVDARKAFG